MFPRGQCDHTQHTLSVTPLNREVSFIPTLLESTMPVSCNKCLWQNIVYVSILQSLLRPVERN